MLTVHYLTAEQTGPGHAGTDVDPWSLADFLAKAGPDMHVWVKAGTYTLTGAAANIIVAGTTYNSSTNTVGKPLWIHGYAVAPGDLDDGAVTTNQPVFTCSNPSGYLQIGQYASNVLCQNITFTCETTAVSGALNVAGECRFRRCRILNTKSGASPGHAIGGTAIQCLFVECYVESQCASTGSAISVTNSVFVGCTMKSKGAIASTSAAFTDCIAFSCIFIADPPAADKAAFTIDSGCVIANCVFDGFPVGIAPYRSTSGEVYGTAFNNIFLNCTTAIKADQTDFKQTRQSCSFFNNAVSGGAISSGFGNDGELPDCLGFQLIGSPFQAGTYELSDTTDGGACKNSAAPTRIQHGNTLNRLDVGAVQSLIEVDYPAQSDTRFGVVYDNGLMTGTCHVPVAADTREDTLVDHTTGTLAVPPRASVEYGVATDNTTGTYRRLMTFEDQSDVVTD